METSSEATEEKLTFKWFNAARILDLPLRASVSDAVAKLHWKSLLRGRAEPCAILICL